MTPPTDRPSPVPSAMPCQDTQTFNALPRVVPVTDPATTATKTAVEEARPSLVGYEILEELGRGGMGVVYKARQQGLGRLVALKMILHADHASTEDRLRFRREAETLAQLRHENIVQVHEVGEHNGKPFMCLEYVEGGGLDRRLAGTPLPPRDAATLVGKLADAMQIAHAHGIIHRDLKPANVLLTGEPAASAAGLGTPKITDFGLAKQQDAAGLSASGAVLGTPSYMAPEQAQGKGKEVDGRADVYALGAILYECLTGRPPFRAATVMDTLMQVIADEPVPPRQLNPGVPRDLETICLKCLAKEPGRRYDTALELSEELRRFCAGEPIRARPVGRIERGWRWARRNPTVASLLSLVLLLMGLGTGIAWMLALRAENEADHARDEKEAAQQARDEEEKQRKKAEANEREMRKARDDERTAREQADRNLAFSRIALAQREWEAGNVQGARDHLDAVPPRMRHWEYGFLYGLAHNPEQTFKGHTGGVLSVAVTADGKRIVSTDGSGTTIVWDATTGKPLPAVKLFAVQGGQRSPDGARLVLADGNLIRIFLRDDDFEARRRLRLTRLALPDPAWHAEQAAVAEAAEEWFAAAFHLARLRELQPWHTETLIRQSHVMLAEQRPTEAVVPFLQALTLTPAVPLWPLSPAAGANALKAAKQGDWPRAALCAERAAHQPNARLTDPILASLAARRPDEAARRWRVQVERFKDADIAQKRSLVNLGQFVLLPAGEATRLAALAGELLAQKKDASALHNLGAAQYRAGQYEQAASTLEESIKLLGRGGYVNTRLFLAMTRQRLGQHAEARRLFDSFASWLKAQDFNTWQEEVQWRRLHDEAKQLILTMPRAEN